MTDRTPLMTHATGSPVVDNTNIQTAGPRGPALLQDIWLSRSWHISTVR
jgi:catalase